MAMARCVPYGHYNDLFDGGLHVGMLAGERGGGVVGVEVEAHEAHEGDEQGAEATLQGTF